MQYRDFGKTGIKLSALGLGTMRLPIKENQHENVDEDETIKIIHHAIDNGINYIDTAYIYHGGNSEVVLGKALKNGYREKVYIADKLALWGAKSYTDLDNIFNTQLEKLGVDCIDFYLIHCLQREFWAKKDELQLLKWCDDIRKSKKIKYLGFSFHDTLDVFKNIVNEYNWDFCQIQYNYMNETVQAGTEGLKYAAKKNLPVMIMEPLLGGMLANISKSMVKMWNKSELHPVETALKWLWDKPEITVVLSGMSTIKQLDENLKFADNSGTNQLNSKEKKTIQNAIVAFNKLMKISCTKCGYCISECQKEIPIPSIIEAYNFYETNKALYPMLYRQIPKQNRGNECTRCKKCEKICPQMIEISKLMPMIHKFFTPDK
jgi:uncharacterized protein